MTIQCTCHRRGFLGWGLAAACFAAADAHGAAAPAPRLAREPDSPIARSSLAHLRGVSDPVMVGHCRRSYQFGMALADKAGARPDAETLYVACLFHDLGLEERYAGPEEFEAIGAREAARYLRSQGADALAERVAPGIELHTAMTTAGDPRPEVAYLHMGVLLDVTGARMDQIPSALVQRVVEEFPREGTKALLTAMLKRQIDTKPGSRIAQMQAAVDVLKRVNDAPFAH